MSLILLYPPGHLYPQYRGVEDALEFAGKLHEQQRLLQRMHPELYNPDTHAIVLLFNLRVIGRKLDTLATSFRAGIKPGQIGGVSPRTRGLLAALQEFNAAVACRDAPDNAVEAAANVLDMAFDCLASLESDIQLFELQN
jgi:hypothetical protein